MIRIITNADQQKKLVALFVGESSLCARKCDLPRQGIQAEESGTWRDGGSKRNY